jgi:hypothetical protein
MLSDFETGKADVAAVSGRDGSWFVYNDTTGTQTPVKVPNTPLPAEAGGACNSGFSFHTTGKGFMEWGAGIGTDLAPRAAGSTAKVAYNSGAYRGIAFRANAAGPQPIRVSVSDKNTAPEGMVCVDTTERTNKQRCGDYFGTEVMVDTTWKDYVLLFAQMNQRGWGLPVAAGVDKTSLYTLRIQVAGTAAKPAVFDFSIDDVRFVK